jgi:hypothetical protein
MIFFSYLYLVDQITVAFSIGREGAIAIML